MLSDRGVSGVTQVCGGRSLSVVDVSLYLREERMHQAQSSDTRTGANAGRDGAQLSAYFLRLPQQFVSGMRCPLWRANVEVRAKHTVVVGSGCRAYYGYYLRLSSILSLLSQALNDNTLQLLTLLRGLKAFEWKYE